MKTRLWLAMLLAFMLWTVMFSPWTAPHLNFWLAMTCSALVLTTLTFCVDGPWWRHLSIEGSMVRYVAENVMLGLVIAIALWCVFWVGDKLSQMMFGFARSQVDGIYGMKEGQNGTVISLLLLFIIGPAEEIFWRNYIQRRLAGHLASWPDYSLLGLKLDARFWAMLVGVAAYTLVHLFSFNFMLIMAAMVCGLAWGGLFWLFPKRLPAIIVSHALWDAAVFIWFPIM